MQNGQLFPCEILHKGLDLKDLSLNHTSAQDLWAEGKERAPYGYSFAESLKSNRKSNPYPQSFGRFAAYLERSQEEDKHDPLTSIDANRLVDL